MARPRWDDTATQLLGDELAHVGLSGLAVGSATAFCQHVRDTRGGDLPGTGLVPFRSALLALDDFDWVIGEIHVSRRSGLMGWRASRLALRQPWRFLRRSRQPQIDRKSTRLNSSH